LGAILQIHVRPDHVPLAPVGDDSPLRFRASDGSYFVPADEAQDLRDIDLTVMRWLRAEDIPVRFSLGGSGALGDPIPEDARLAVLARLLAEQRANAGVSVRFLGRQASVPPDGFVLDKAGGDRHYVWQVVADEPAGAALGRERFPNLYALLQDEKARVALSLGAGGLKLFAHAPALRLIEHLGCGERIDEVWGTSAGALAALLYCHGLSPQAIEQTGYDLYTGRYRLDLRPSKLHVVKEVLREVLLPPSGDATDAGFVDCARGLQRMLSEYCNVIRPARPLYVLAFNLDEGRVEALTPESVPEHLREIATQTDAREATFASCAVPLLFMPRSITRPDGAAHYVDGSTTEDVPLRSIVRKWDLDRAAGVESRERLIILYVKLSSPSAAKRSTNGRLGKVRLLQAVATASMQALHERDVELIAARPDVCLLPLELREPGTEFFEISRIPAYIRRARESFPEQLDAIEQRLRQPG